ncbi:MAG: transposase [Scytolyngbya sp. HA4215-MV1]|jgi:transposase-like protein|nr:transposase [Scytolyngbya sp. HA4215-MV1]
MPRNQTEFITLLEQIRWNGQPTCPYCGSIKSSMYKKTHRYHCNSCFTAYSVTVGTLFHKTHVDLQKWFKAIHLIFKSSSNISVRSLSKEIGVSKNTASYMISRIQKAMVEEVDLLHKIIEIDEP